MSGRNGSVRRSRSGSSVVKNSTQASNVELCVQYPCALVRNQLHAFFQQDLLFLSVAMVLQGLFQSWQDLPSAFGTEALTRTRLQQLGLPSRGSSMYDI